MKRMPFVKGQKVLFMLLGKLREGDFINECSGKDACRINYNGVICTVPDSDVLRLSEKNEGAKI